MRSFLRPPQTVNHPPVVTQMRVVLAHRRHPARETLTSTVSFLRAPVVVFERAVSYVADLSTALLAHARKVAAARLPLRLTVPPQLLALPPPGRDR